MKALILAAGLGVRLRPLTGNTPKSLIKIGEGRLLDYQLISLIKCGIKDIIIIIGHYGSKIKDYVRERYAGINVSCVRNSRYRTTNYAYSMLLAGGLIDDDVVFLHGDLLFDIRLLNKLVRKSHRNCVLVSRTSEPPEGDFRAVIKKGRVVKIGVGFSGENVFYCAPLYKFSREDFLYWLEEIEGFIKAGDVKSYAEDVFNEISDKITLHPLYFDREICMEIDTREDLAVAESIIARSAIRE